MGSNLGARPEPRYSNRLNGIPLGELFEMGEAVQALAAHSGWNHVQALLDAEVADIDRALENARQPLSQAEYAQAHGRRGGLRAAREVVEAILNRYEATLAEQRRKHESGAESPQEAVVS